MPNDAEKGARSQQRYHERARRRGVNRVVYWIVRAVLQPAMRIWFRLERQGRENIPARGPVAPAADRCFGRPIETFVY